MGFAMGVLHYTPDEALNASIIHLIIAREGTINWHNMIHGGGKSGPKFSDKPITDEGRADVASKLRGFLGKKR